MKKPCGMHVLNQESKLAGPLSDPHHPRQHCYTCTNNPRSFSQGVEGLCTYTYIYIYIWGLGPKAYGYYRNNGELKWKAGLYSA